MRMRRVAAAGLALAAIGAGPVRAEDAARDEGRQRPRATEPVVVTATRTPLPAGGVIGSIDVVTGAQLAASGAPDLKAALATVPSLVLNDVGGAAGLATISLRGATSMQTLVLLDGRRLANAQSSFFDLGILPVTVERIDRIEVMPMPASALYGADALGGVVNVITRPAGTKPELNLSLGSGSNGEWRTAGGAQAALGGVGLRLDGQLRSGDGHRENGDFDLRTLTGTASMKPAPWGMNLSWEYLDREAGVPGPLAFPSPNARQEDERRGLRADFTYLPLTGWDVRAGVSSAEQTLEYRDPDFYAGPLTSRHENRALGADLQWNFDTGSGELYTIGGEFSSDRIESSNDGEHESERWGVYAQDQWRAGGLSAVGAVRRDHHSVWGDETSPSLSVAWETPEWKVWGATARGYRAPNFDDLYWNDPSIKGNPDLKPETSWSWEAGAESRWGEAGRLRFAYFRRRVKNLIRWADDDGDFVYTAGNTARARVRGVEGELRWNLTGALSVPVGYQALSSEDEESGEQITGLVRRLWRVGAEYTGRSFTSSLTWAQTDRGSYSYREGAWRYATLDAAIGWKGALGKTPVRASLRLENLRDRAYETVEGYPMPGRTLFAEVGIGI